MKRAAYCSAAALYLCVCPFPQAQVPAIITYQGRVQVEQQNFSGAAQMKFALVSAGSNTVRRATASATVTSGFLTGVTVLNGGSGYISPPPVTITDASGSGASAVAQVSGGAVVSITVQNAGAGYSPSPTITIAEPPPLLAFQSFCRATP